MEREITPKTVTLDWLDYVILKKESENKKESNYYKTVIEEILKQGDRLSIMVKHYQGTKDVSLFIKDESFVSHIDRTKIDIKL